MVQIIVDYRFLSSRLSSGHFLLSHLETLAKTLSLSVPKFSICQMEELG